MIVTRSRHWPTIWFLVAAGICMVAGLLGALGAASLWFLLAIVFDGVALVLFMRNRAPENPGG